MGVEAPTGMISAWGGAVAPTCWLLCDGASYLRTAWPALFAVIGTAYGSADPSHFNVPDLRGRSPLGVSPGLPAPRPTARVRGAVGGEEEHVLTLPESAAHDHGGLTGYQIRQGVGGVQEIVWMESAMNSAAPGHAHTIASAGGGLAHGTMHPFQVVEFIIKT